MAKGLKNEGVFFTISFGPWSCTWLTGTSRLVRCLHVQPTHHTVARFQVTGQTLSLLTSLTSWSPHLTARIFRSQYRWETEARPFATLLSWFPFIHPVFSPTIFMASSPTFAYRNSSARCYSLPTSTWSLKDQLKHHVLNFSDPHRSSCFCLSFPQHLSRTRVSLGTWELADYSSIRPWVLGRQGHSLFISAAQNTKHPATLAEWH